MQRLEKMQRELTLMRWLVVFISICVGIIFFAPAAAMRVAEWTAPFVSLAGPAIAFVALIAVLLFAVAAIVSHHSPPRPNSTENDVEHPLP